MINGIPYPLNVRDEASLNDWIGSIQREVGYSKSALAIDRNDTAERNAFSKHTEVLKYANFNSEKEKGFAEQVVCQAMASILFSHLIHVPNGKLIWRVRPEFDVSHDTIPADLSKIMTREQIDDALGKVTDPSPISLEEAEKELGKTNWGINFVTDTIFPVSAPLGEWKLFKSYMRYSVVLGNEVIYSKYGMADRTRDRA